MNVRYGLACCWSVSVDWKSFIKESVDRDFIRLISYCVEIVKLSLRSRNISSFTAPKHERIRVHSPFERPLHHLPNLLCGQIQIRHLVGGQVSEAGDDALRHDEGVAGEDGLDVDEGV